MPKPDVLEDWSSLSDQEKPAAIAAYRKRLDRIGRKLHAVVGKLPSHARPGGPLKGMPCAVKDLIATGVSVPTWGLAQPVIDETAARAPVLQRLDMAGADVMVTAEMTALAYEPSGYNAARGRVLNPWNTSIVCGGSSSGSAVLVASGCCYVALGSDTGGSVRIPASCCGVTALKPGLGVVSLEGVMPLAPSLDTVGLIARSAADLALAWTAITDQEVPLFTPLKAVLLQDAFTESEPAVAQACRQAVSALSRHKITVTEEKGFSEQADVNALCVLLAEAARTHSALIEDSRLDPMLRKRMSKGLKITDAELAIALQQRDKLRDEFLAKFGDTDIAILPTMPIRTPRVSEAEPDSPDFSPAVLYGLSRFTRFVNYFGLPAMSLPAGQDDRGLPVGLQIVGRPGSEALLLSIAVKFQSGTDWHGRVPHAIAADIAAEGLAA